MIISIKISQPIELYRNKKGINCSPCTAAIVAITFAIYMMRPFYPDCDPPPGMVQLLAALLLRMYYICFTILGVHILCICNYERYVHSKL